MTQFLVTQSHNTDADDPLAAVHDAEANNNTIYRVEDELGSVYEVDLADNTVRPITPF